MAFLIEYSTRWISPLPEGTATAPTAVEALRIIDELRTRYEVIQHVRLADGSEISMSQLTQIAKEERL